MKRQVDEDLRHAIGNLEISHKYLLNNQVPEATSHLCLALAALKKGRERDQAEVDKLNNKGG